MTGIGLILNASLIIADEATTSLDVIVEAKLVDQLREIRDQYGVAILAISHNIALIAEMADRIAVMYAGQIVEMGDIKDVFKNRCIPIRGDCWHRYQTLSWMSRKNCLKWLVSPPI